jgi:hypothetical protein
MAASALADPDTPPIMVLSTTFTCANPPTICPVSTSAICISLELIPE